MPGDCPLAAAVRRCPFLSQLGAREGEAFARRVAANPFAPAAGQPPLLEEEGLSGYEATLRLFHGPGGVVPLRRFADAPAPSTASGCPFRAAAAAAAAAPPTTPAGEPASAAQPAGAAARCVVTEAARAPAGSCTPARALPFASISLSGFGFVPDPGQFFNRPPRSKKQQQPQQRKPADPGSGRSGSGSGARPGATSGSSPGASSGGSSGSGTGRLRPGHGAGGPAGQFKRVLGGLLPLAAGGHLSCPAPIVKMRAAIAALKPVRDLRPQALPIRALAMSGTAIAAGLPCGMWREHTKKFSPQWFLAVHAAIPFVAMLRKAVLMPKWAILLTLIGSIAGQTLGARMERQRLVQLSARRQPALTALTATSGSACSAPPPARNDCVMPGLEAGCRQCLKAAQSAISWTLAPVVVQ